jgi:L-histidine Nalpha-methyltransferase
VTEPQSHSAPAAGSRWTDADSPVRVDVHLAGEDEETARAELKSALAETPRRMPSRFFYDAHGSDLFVDITALPEYYPTRTEAAILRASADDAVATSAACELMELGSGAAQKTRILLDAMERSGCLRVYVPVDVSESMVRRTARELVEEYPGLRIHGVVADFLHGLDVLPPGGTRLVIFLGGTIGNLDPDQARAFLRGVHDAMKEGDHLLLGTDLIKDIARLEAAYDDSQGVTAAFNKNILPVVNALVDGDFDPDKFRHRAVYDVPKHRIEMRLVSLEDQTVSLPGIGIDLELSKGEEILTEISTKYDREKVESLLTGTGFELVRWYTDPDELFALSLARRGDS